MMRLGKSHVQHIDEVARKALSGECMITVPAPSWRLARQIFEAATPHMEERGARVAGALVWAFSNGSHVKVSILELAA